MSTLTGTSPWIVDVTEADFQARILDASQKTPVVVDFWATWCGPCKTLGPILEKLAVEMNGRFVLAKVDVDRNPNLAAAMRIQSVPTVMVIHQGRVVDGFPGALPEVQVRQFLEEVLPPPPDDPWKVATALEQEGATDEAIALLEQTLGEHPKRDDCRLLLGRLLIDAGRFDEARGVLAGLDFLFRDTPEAKEVLARLDFAEEAGHDLAPLKVRIEADPADLASRIQLGKILIGKHRYEEGLEHLLEAVRRDRTFDEGAARRAMVEAFDLLGGDHPLTQRYRSRLSNLLFV